MLCGPVTTVCNSHLHLAKICKKIKLNMFGTQTVISCILVGSTFFCAQLSSHCCERAHPLAKALPWKGTAMLKTIYLSNCIKHFKWKLWSWIWPVGQLFTVIVIKYFPPEFLMCLCPVASSNWLLCNTCSQNKFILVKVTKLFFLLFQNLQSSHSENICAVNPEKSHWD